MNFNYFVNESLKRKWTSKSGDVVRYVSSDATEGVYRIELVEKIKMGKDTYWSFKFLPLSPCKKPRTFTVEAIETIGEKE